MFVADVIPKAGVILDRDNYEERLDTGMTNVHVISKLLKPYDSKSMRCFPVSGRVNRVGNDDEECSACSRSGCLD